MSYPYTLPPALPVPAEGAPAEEWKAYNDRNWFVYSAQLAAVAARLAEEKAAREVSVVAAEAEHRAAMLALRQREVAATEKLAEASTANTAALADQARFEQFIGRIKMLADIVERRGTDRTASGALDQVKLTADVKAILTVAHAALADLTAAMGNVEPAPPASPAPPAPPTETPRPGLAG